MTEQTINEFFKLATPLLKFYILVQGIGFILFLAVFITVFVHIIKSRK